MGRIDDRLLAFAENLTEIRKEIKNWEEKLAVLKKWEQSILCDDIPSLFAEFGLQEATFMNGESIRLEHYIDVKQHDPIALRSWLIDNGMGAIVKEEFSFRKGVVTKSLVDFLEKEEYQYDREVTVNTNSLKAQIKQHLLQGGEAPPREAAEVSIFTRAKFTSSKE